jgi:hypothetical protein
VDYRQSEKKSVDVYWYSALGLDCFCKALSTFFTGGISEQIEISGMLIKILNNGKIRLWGI